MLGQTSDDFADLTLTSLRDRNKNKVQSYCALIFCQHCKYYVGTLAHYKEYFTFEKLDLQLPSLNFSAITIRTDIALKNTISMY